MNNEKEVLEKVKKKIRESFEVNKESKEAFISSKVDAKEPAETLYGNYQGRNEYKDNKSKEREQGFQRQGNFSRSRDRNSFSFRSRDRNSFRSNSRNRQGVWKNKREGTSFSQKDGRNQAENMSKRTYKVEKINFDIDKSVF